MNDLKVASWMLGLCEEERVHPQVHLPLLLLLLLFLLLEHVLFGFLIVSCFIPQTEVKPGMRQEVNRNYF